MRNILFAPVVVLALAAGPAALAQSTAADAAATSQPVVGDPVTEPTGDDDDFPWGLLGLIGLAGLLGRKRNDDVHVHRTDNTVNRP